MARVALIVGGTALAALAACTTYDPNYTANPPNPDPTPLASSARGNILLPAGTVVAAPTAPAVVATPAVPIAPVAPVVAAGGTPTVAVAPATSTFQAGNGTVQAVSLVQVAPSASAGSSIGSVVTRSAYRLTIRMDDGTVQTLDQDSGAFRVGDRVEITRDAHIVRR